MIELLGKTYINEKEAALRYGYSRDWFRKSRCQGDGPPFVKVHEGKILYSIDETDQWFRNNMKKSDDI